MNERIHATRVIASRRIFEAIITPGYYVVLTIGLLLAYVLVTTFPTIVDTSGLMPSTRFTILLGGHWKGDLARHSWGSFSLRGPLC